MSSFRLNRGLLSLAPEMEEEEDEPLPLPLSPGRSTRLPLFAINLDEMEEEEQDMPLEPALSEGAVSQQFLDAQRGVEENKYDTGAWRTYVHESTRGKAGSLAPADAYSALLAVFPGSARHWQALAAAHLADDDAAEAEKVFAKATLQRLRSVDLWLGYIDLVRRSSLDRRRCEELFEAALADVGGAVDSGPLWRKYLDYASDTRDPARLLSLRRIYQRALVVPMDALDAVWQEYERLERGAGDSLAEQLLPELRDKCAHAKLAYKERKRLVAACDLDRLAVPPSNSAAELAQLDAWNRLFKAELKAADALEVEQTRQFLLVAHDQFLSCFRLHPEAWVAHAHFGLAALGADAALATLREAVEVLPASELVRIALADAEEERGCAEGAREVLRAALRALPSGLMFAAYQRFLRRVDGVVAARRLFSECLAQGREQERPLDSAAFICHALMELNVNNEPLVAMRTLEHCKTLHRSVATTVPFVRALGQVLLRMGDHLQLQWVFANALEPCTVVEEGVDALAEEEQESSVLSAKDTAELWEDLFRIECDLGLSSFGRIGELRRRCVKAAADYEESLRGRAPAQSFEGRDLPQGVLSIMERFEGLDVLGLGSVDGGIRSRCLRLADAHTGRRGEREREPSDGKRRARRDDAAHVSESLHAVSLAVRELVQRLPSASLAGVDVSGFIEQLRRLALPARPAAEESARAPASSGNKRLRNATDDEADGAGPAADDVFKTRQRARFAK